MNNIEKEIMSKHLKRIMQVAKDTNQTFIKDWSTTPLPALPRESKLLSFTIIRFSWSQRRSLCPNRGNHNGDQEAWGESLVDLIGKVTGNSLVLIKSGAWVVSLTTFTKEDFHLRCKFKK